MESMMTDMSNQLSTIFGGFIPNLLGAIAILVVGWIIALTIAAGVRGLLRRTTLATRIAQGLAGDTTTTATEVERVTGKIVFYLIMLFVLVGVFQTLQLTYVIEPLNRLLSQVFQFVPQILAAALLLGLAWLLATMLRTLLSRALQAARVDARLGERSGLAEGAEVPLSESLASLTYWLVFLLFIPAILSTLELEGLLEPVKDLTQKLLGFLPNVFAAGLIGMIGWFLARIVQRVVTNLSAAAGVDQLSDRVGLATILGPQRFSAVLGLLVHVLILIPVIIGALNALALESITQPASAMLTLILDVIPNLLAAALIVIIAYVVGRLLKDLVARLLGGIGFNTFFVRVGLMKQEQTEGLQAPSTLVGHLVLVVLLLFAGIEAANQLGLEAIASLIVQFMLFGGHLILGLVIFVLGLFLANLAARTIQASQTAQAGILAQAARIAVLVLAAAMALQQIGVANEIINLAFGLMLGAIAVAVALAVGLGSRDIVAEEIKAWVKARKESSSGR